MTIFEQRNQPDETSENAPSERPRARKEAAQGGRRDPGGRSTVAPRAKAEACDPWWANLGAKDDRQGQIEARKAIDHAKHSAMAEPQARMPDGGGVYIIVNAVNMRTYVGQTANFRRREQWHKSALRYLRHTNKVLQRDWSEHGEKSFWFIPILAPQSIKNWNLFGVEAKAIRAHALDECYNLLSIRERTHAEDGSKLKCHSFKLTQNEWSAFHELGGVDWLRDAIQKTKPPA